MTGTSIDAIDVAVVNITGSGLNIGVEVYSFASFPLTSLADDLRELASGKSKSPCEIAEIELQLGEQIAASLGVQGCTDLLDLAVVHGQTIYHKPPLTWQLLNPWPIASKIAAPVLYDLRRADIATNGQGAPLTPIADAILFGHESRTRTIVNLGGFCNITILPKSPATMQNLDSVQGFDLCPCNHWLDGVMRLRTGIAYDNQGELASTGSIVEPLARSLIDRWSDCVRHNRSLGTDDDLLFDLADYSTADVLATCCEVIAQLIRQVCSGSDELICAGGSVKNEHLVSRIRAHSSAPVIDMEGLGIDPQAREAVALAVLGALCLDNQPIGLPQITGSRKAIISGSWCLPTGTDRIFHG